MGNFFECICKFLSCETYINDHLNDDDNDDDFNDIIYEEKFKFRQQLTINKNMVIDDDLMSINEENDNEQDTIEQNDQIEGQINKNMAELVPNNSLLITNEPFYRNYLRFFNHAEFYQQNSETDKNSTHSSDICSKSSIELLTDDNDDLEGNSSKSNPNDDSSYDII